ncbi:MAG: dihydroorotate dehydrogenase-like protein [Candidatus Hydrogenedens sp.]|nr:dihydroorotate dehydrogenase-like protein [Candidatus Hydrogenedentota bacterium]NLF58175.1 dihydroorotate dehydrogenase-like protein [Candidatus Hydrogenedens sp.]
MDLTTSYLGMTLKNPIVVSPSPISEPMANIRKLEDAGAGAIVLHSLFEEQLTFQSQELNANLQQGEQSFAEALTYFPDLEDYKMGPEGYLGHIRRAKEAVGIPIIASLNGVSAGGWTGYAKEMAEAGADAIELNVYYVPTNPAMSGQAVEDLYVDLVKSVKASVSIPVAVKIGPYFSSVANMAKRLSGAGADALVMFNRFYQPDLDLKNLEVKPDLVLSNPLELRLRLRWVAILFGHIAADMAVTGGVHTGQDVVKCMMAGAKAAMTTSALLKHGIGHLAVIRNGLENWMEENEYESVAQMQGAMSQKNCAEPAAFERANYMKILTNYIAETPKPMA